jgi:heme exporter protein B
MIEFLRDAWVIAKKDLTIEYRTRSAFLSSIVFALVAMVIFYFAWDRTSVGAYDLAPGVLWALFVFSGMLGLHRSFGVEQADRAIDGLLASPVSREAIFAGKAFANLVFVLGVQAIAVPALALFFNVTFLDGIGPLSLVIVLSAIGLVSVGTLFAAMASNTRLAELLLPMLSLPFFIPVVIPAAQATVRILDNRPFQEIMIWVRMLVAFDLIFLLVCIWIYPFTLEE